MARVRRLDNVTMRQFIKQDVNIYRSYVHRYQKWPHLKGVTFSKPSLWVSVLVFSLRHRLALHLDSR